MARFSFHQKLCFFILTLEKVEIKTGYGYEFDDGDDDDDR